MKCQTLWALVGVLVSLTLGCAAASQANAPSPAVALAPNDPASDAAYAAAVRRTAAMVEDEGLLEEVNRRGLALTNVTWEDTGRELGSALGPNISDFTLQVRHRVPPLDARNNQLAPWFIQPDLEESTVRWEETLMPVIRPPNFADRTADIPVDRFFVRVGNQRGNDLTSVPLLDLIRDVGRFASDPRSLGAAADGAVVDLSAPRDTHFLVSAQALFLPIPRKGRAEYNPVLFNYQSAPGSPAVLAILATREGTSMTVIENRREDQGAHWGQELYFNDAGERACFMAERRTDVVARMAAQGGPKTASERSAIARGADVMALIQIPLRHENRGLLGGVAPAGDGYGYEFSDDPMQAGGFGPNDATIRVRPGPVANDVDRAVVGHGSTLGPFLEGHGGRLQRDPTFPIRITLQFYKATSTGEVAPRELDGIATTLQAVYAHADYVGSLVLPEGDEARPTAWAHVPGEWFPW